MQKISVKVIAGIRSGRSIDVHKSERMKEVIDMGNSADNQSAIGGYIGVVELNCWIETNNPAVLSPNGCLRLQLDVQTILYVRISRVGLLKAEDVHARRREKAGEGVTEVQSRWFGKTTTIKATYIKVSNSVLSEGGV